MLLKIFSSALELIGVVDDYASVKIEKNFRGIPNVKIKAKLSDNIRAMLRPGNVIFAEDADESFVIDYVSYDNEGTESRSAHVTAMGKGVLSMLSRRAVRYRLLHIGGLGQLMQSIVNGASSAMPGSVVCDIAEISKSVIIEQNYGDTCEVLCDLCRIFSVGMSMKFHPNTKSFTFRSLGEIDCSTDQTQYPPIIYSRERENVISEFYVNDASALKTTAYIYGSENGQGSRYSTTAGDTSSPDRREIVIFANDLSIRRYESNGATDVASYIAALKRRGEETLATLKETKSHHVTITPTATPIPPLGTICTILNQDWNIKSKATITKEQSITQNGKTEKTITLSS